MAEDGLWQGSLACFRRGIRTVSEIVSGDGGDRGFDFDFGFGRGESDERIGACGCFVVLCPCLGDWTEKLAWMMSRRKRFVSVLLSLREYSYRLRRRVCETVGVCVLVSAPVRCHSLKCSECDGGDGDDGATDVVTVNVIVTRSDGAEVMRYVVKDH